jgi:putative oxidoreductase
MKQKTIYQDILPLTARVIFAGVFLANAAGLSGAFSNVVRMMAAKGLPAPAAILGLTIAAWLIGGLCLLTGWRVRLAATALALLMIPVTLGMHAPWTADAASFQNELNNFLKNLGFIAGLLALAAGHAGLLAMDDKGVHGRAATGSAQSGLR